jgi:hypothetical protein
MTAPTIPSEAMRQIVVRALNSPHGIKIEFESAGDAIKFHQRYNSVRSNEVRRDGASEWRTLQMRRDGTTLYLEPVDQHILRLKISEIEGSVDFD